VADTSAGASADGATRVFRDVPRIFYFVNVPAVLVGVAFLLFADTAFPSLPAWWRWGILGATVVAAAVLTLMNIVRPRLVIEADSVTVVAPWQRHRYAWDDLRGWFVADQGGWCRIALVPSDGGVTVAPAPLDTRSDPRTGSKDTVPARLAPAAAALDEELARRGRAALEPTPELRESGRRSAYRLVWSTLLVPANLIAVAIVASFLMAR